MSKKKAVPPSRSIPTKSLAVKTLPPHQNPLYAALLLGFIAFALYLNSIFNDYALDDIISITGNSFTKKGLGGIKDLINKDSFVGFIGNASELSGGRWRPLALITFAIEWEFFPNSPHLSHFVNVLLYGLTAFVMFNLLYKFVFKNNIGASFAATFLFVIHPIHTEAVANIKSRDEVLSFLLLVCSIWFLMRHCHEKQKFSLLIASLICYFLALLSKENGLTFVAIVPMTLFVFANYNFRKALTKSIPFALIAGFYFFLRIAVIGFTHKTGGIQEIMNAPYLLATPVQEFATKIYVLLLYLKMLFIPHPLSYDYSYNQIPYVDFSNAIVWISIAVQIGLVAFAFWKIRERSILAYGILFYFFNIFIVSNLIIDIGGVMGERFLYQPSFGFAIALVAFVQLIYERLGIEVKTTFAISVALLVVLSVPASIEIIARNKDWKNDKHLFVKDVYTTPNSARSQSGAGMAYILLSDDYKKTDSVKSRAMLDSAVMHMEIALKIYPNYVDPYLNLGTVYNRTGEIEKTEAMWNEARKRNSTHPKLTEYYPVLSIMYLQRGVRHGADKNYAASIHDLRKAVEYNPSNDEAWYNLGGIYFTVQNGDSAVIAFKRTLLLKPDHKEAQLGLRALEDMYHQAGRPMPEVR